MGQLSMRSVRAVRMMTCHHASAWPIGQSVRPLKWWWGHLGAPTHTLLHSTIMGGQAPKTCLLSKSQFWSNATENVKNQLPIGFGPGDFSRNKRFEHFFFFLPCAFFFPKSRYGKKRLRRGMEKCLRSAQNEISV